MIAYLLGIASPTHPIPASMYYSGFASQSDFAVQYRQVWGRTTEGDHFTNGHSFYGIKLDVGVGEGGGLFFTHYSFLGFDPRGKRDRYTNYFQNSRNIALIAHAYAIANPLKRVGYGDNSWRRSDGVNARRRQVASARRQRHNHLHGSSGLVSLHTGRVDESAEALLPRFRRQASGAFTAFAMASTKPRTGSKMSTWA